MSNTMNKMIQLTMSEKGAAEYYMKETIIFNGSTNDEMLKITHDGFYVRGVKVHQDEHEAETVYKTFHQWLTWATLTRNF